MDSFAVGDWVEEAWGNPVYPRRYGRVVALLPKMIRIAWHGEVTYDRSNEPQSWKPYAEVWVQRVRRTNLRHMIMEVPRA